MSVTPVLKRRGPSKVLLPALPAILLIGVLAWGIVILGWRSIHDYDAYTNSQGDLSFIQYLTMFSGDHVGYFGGVIVRTLIISVVVMIGVVVLALPVAYFIVRTRSNAWRMLVLALSLVPFLMGDVVRAFGWTLLLGTDGAYGWVSGWFLADRLTLIGSPVGVLVGILQTMVPICIFVLLPAVRRVDPDIERAAATLGAPPRIVWRKVVLPLLWPGIVASSIVAFALTTTQYAIPEVVGGGRMPFAANAIQSAFFNQGNINLGSALAMLMLVIVLIVVAIAGATGRTRVRHPDRAGDSSQVEASS